jgi:hypothetical protein
MRIALKLNEKAVKTQLRDFSGVRRGRRQWQKGALNRGGDSSARFPSRCASNRGDAYSCH